jgi:Ca-activated chloride channel family protein
MSQQYPKVEFFTSREKLKADQDQTVEVLIRISPPEPDSRAERTPLNLSLVMDRSGSMSGDKIARAREAAMYCVDQMLPSDRLSVVVFDDRIDVLFPSESVTNKQSMKNLISRIQSRGSTALHEAWVRGGLTITEQMLAGGINRVLLITDGLANVGLTNPDEIVSQAMELYKRGVSTSTIGIGDDFNEDLLLQMAEAAGGNAWHVVEPDDMQRIFQVELDGLVAQFAHTVSLSLIPADGVRIVDVLNDFELTDTGRYRLPNLLAGSPLELVVQLRVGAHAIGDTLRLLDLRLGFTPQGANSAEVLKCAHTVEFVDENSWEKLSANNDVIKSVQFLMNARARREAMVQIDRGDYTTAGQILGASIANTRAACASFIDAESVAEECAQLEEVKTSLTDRLKDKLSRKKLAYGAYSRQTGKL